MHIVLNFQMYAMLNTPQPRNDVRCNCVLTSTAGPGDWVLDGPTFVKKLCGVYYLEYNWSTCWAAICLLALLA